MRKAIAFVLTLVLVLAMASTTSWAKPNKSNEFKDIKGNYSYQSILKLQELGILSGYPDGTFRPKQPLKGAELDLIIDRLLERQGQHDPTNEPVNKENLKRFHSNVQVTRLNAAAALAQALGLTTSGITVTDNPFHDIKNMSNDDYKYLIALHNAGYIKGFPDGNFNPNSLFTRGEMAKIIDNVTGDLNDKTPPAWPTNSAVTATAVQSDSVRLTWTGAKDNDKVIGYKVLYDQASVATDSALVKTVFYKNTANIDNLLPNTAYLFQILARDAAGNWSTTGPTITVTTAAIADTIAPVWSSTAAMTATPSATTSSSFALGWPDATDNVAVTGYLLYETDNHWNNPVLVDSLGADANSTEISGLTDHITHYYVLKARDRAGNQSLALTLQYTKPN